LVSTDVQGYKSVSYVNVVPVLVEAIKQQQGQLLAQQKQIEGLQAENASLQARTMRIEALEAQLAALAAIVRDIKAGQGPATPAR